MGIINVTPDSFSDGGINFKTNSAIENALNLIEEGADILDIGGESTRPGAGAVSEQEEIDRVLPVIEGILKYQPNTYISIDTTKYEVAKSALIAGVKMVNDVSGLKISPDIPKLCKEYDADLCIMHMQGTPRTMQKNPHYKDIINEIHQFLIKQTEFALSNGVRKIYVDVGIGFGKTVEDNLHLLKNLEKFNGIGYGQLLGISRKSFIGRSFDIEGATDRDIITAFIHSLLLTKSVKIVRVHNVKLLNSLRRTYQLMN